MIDPINTTMALAMSSFGVVVAVTSPVQYAPDIASIFVGVCGGLLVQGWTIEARKPTKSVMASDIAASAFSGYMSRVIGVPVCVGFMNKFLPEDFQLKFDPTNDIGWVVICAGLAGMVGAHFLRKFLDRVNPGWNDPKPK